jgi:hypothetical protein
MNERIERLNTMADEGRVIRNAWTGTDAQGREVACLLAACAARWSSLDDAAWRRVEIAARRASVVEAMSHTTDERVLNVSRTVLAWLDDDMPEQPREAAAEAARAWLAAARAEARRGAAEDAVVREAKAAAADRIIDAVLTALEKECGL